MTGKDEKDYQRITMARDMREMVDRWSAMNFNHSAMAGMLLVLTFNMILEMGWPYKALIKQAEQTLLRCINVHNADQSN